jgi:hypothetical protein
VILQLKNLGLLVLMTCAAVLVHGYHPNAEDAAIYLPGVEKQLDPGLFPFNQQFFASHSNYTLFPQLIAQSVRITHLSLYSVLLFWHLFSIFLLLLACYQLACLCTESRAGRWASVALVAALLTVPVAGTALYILDQYVNPRNLAAFAAVFAVVMTAERRLVASGLFLMMGLAIHPFMSVFAFGFCLLMWLTERGQEWRRTAVAFVPLGFLYPAPTPAYHQVAISHPYHYLLRWQWYEIVGAIAPLGIFWFGARFASRHNRLQLQRMCHAAIVLGGLSFLAALVLAVPARFEVLARVQPLRSFYLLYILMIVFLGSLLGEFVLQGRAGRWLIAFLPLCGGMFVVQRMLFPDSAHVELPGVRSRNPWVEAFEWTRHNTPEDARFALDPLHMRITGEDANGFRAIAERSMLADAVKDSGAVSMFPAMADEWLRQVEAQTGWRRFQIADFRRLQSEYGIDWVVLQTPPLAGLECPYQNSAVAVCRLEAPTTLTQQFSK